MPDFAVATAFTGKGNIVSYMGQAGAAVDKFGSRADKAFKRASGSGLSLMGVAKMLVPAFGFYQLFNYAKQAIDEYEKQEVAIANVEAGLKATNNAIGISSKQLQDMASNWQKVGIFGDDTILQNVTAQLLTFGSIGKKNFDAMQGAAMDITSKLYGVTASGEQLRDVTIMLGKAMDDPARGMTALRRRGIQFTDQQENMIKTMQQVQGREAAQAYLLKEINRLYGGTNEALAKTDKGMEIVAKNAMGDTMEELGKQLVPLKHTLIELAVAVLPAFNTGIEVVSKIIKDYYPLILAAAGAWGLYKVAILAVQGAHIVMNIVSWISYLWMMRSAIMQAVSVTKIWTGIQWLLNAAMSANPIGIIIIAVATLVGWIIYLNTHLEEMRKLFMDITSILDKPWVQALLMTLPGMNTAMALRQNLKQAQAQSPNRTEVESRRQGVDVSGSINVYGPEGTQVKKSNKSAPGIDWNNMGPNTAIGAFGSY